MTSRRRLLPAALAFGSALFIAGSSAATAEVRIFRADSHQSFAKGSLEGVSVHPQGSLQLARQMAVLTQLEEPFVFSAAPAGRGYVVGTGNAGRVLAVDPAGVVSELFTSEEPEIFAVASGPDGEIYAGSSPAGKVYRISPDGATEVIFDPEEQYIWGLAVDAQGDLLVATGLMGRLYRVGAGGVELLADVGDNHLRSLALLTDGSLLLGTAGQGRILRLSAGGELTTLHDSLLSEVLAFAPRADGGAWAAVLASEASLLDLSAGSAAKATESGEPAVTVVVEETTLGSRGGGATGPRSVLLDIRADGTVREVESFSDSTIHSLAIHDGELWIGTGEEGALFRRSGDHLILEHDLEERQIPALVSHGDRLAAVTTNGAAIYTLGREVAKSGTFTSAVLDAQQPAQFGSFSWDGPLPDGTAVELSFRSGMSLQPDATWTAWSTPREGRSVSLSDLSDGRYVQWRARLLGKGVATPRLRGVELSYRQRNLAPEITSFSVFDPGKILVPNNFNPAAQTFEPASPNRDGIFTTLRSAPTAEESRGKELWKKGYRTLSWEADDPNGDELVYDLEFRRDLAPDGGEDLADDEGWLTMAEGIEDTWYSFDATVLPDGRYRFRLSASDRPVHPAESARDEQMMSDETVVDNSPPRLLAARSVGAGLEVELADELSPLREAVVSFDAGEWHSANPVDGLLDGRRETLVVDIDDGAKLLLLRVTDAAFNVVTFDLLAASR